MEENRSITAVQNWTEYQPTEKERIILELLLTPENRTKSITDICRLANCSRTIYYDAMAKPEFKALYENKTKDLIKQSIGPVVNTFVREALRGSFQHGKVILEMAGLYSEKSTLEVTGEVNLISPEERQKRISELQEARQKVLEGIKVEYELLPEPDPDTD
jgi:hypothetical protein